MLSASWTNRGTRTFSLTRRIWLGVVALVMAVGSARAQNPAPANLPPVDAAPTDIRATTLDECISIALGRQPALAAARASLAAAESGKRGLDSLTFGGIIAPDLHIRKQQACLGVSIAAAGLTQAEWETRYAVVRTYWSVQYAQMQRNVIDSVIGKLDRAHKKAKDFVGAGDPNIKVTQIDVDNLALNLELAKAKRAEADVGMKKATAALREAMGIGLGEPLAIPVETLPTAVPSLNKDELVQYALANRPEMSQAVLAKEIADLEIRAQHWTFNPSAKTFAAGADIHAKPIPQGVANGEYRPGATGPEMPTFLVGKRPERVQRASDYATRAQAVVDKTNNLIALEVEANYLKWLEAAEKIRNLQNTPDSAGKIADKVQARFNEGNVSGEELLRAQTMEDLVRSQYTEALFNQVLGLAALERATAGGYKLTVK
jgi:outer membrane protein TolC